jgi:hypothetical protein
MVSGPFYVPRYNPGFALLVTDGLLRSWTDPSLGVRRELCCAIVPPLIRRDRSGINPCRPSVVALVPVERKLARTTKLALTALASLVVAVTMTGGLATMVTDRLATTMADGVFQHGRHEQIPDRLWHVKLGTPMESVSRYLLFDPVRVEEGTDHVVWHYDRSAVAAAVPAIVFDKQTERVVAVHIDDKRWRIGPCYVGRPPDTPSE